MVGGSQAASDVHRAYSRFMPRTCGRWWPSEMPSVGNCLAISSAVRGPGTVAV
jgi:hypothetical protein